MTLDLTPSSDEPPLVVDLDGTFTVTDTLWESIVRLIKRRPVVLVMLPFWLMQGRAQLKATIWARSTWNAQGLPLNQKLHEYLVAQRRQGRRLVLATAAHEALARKVVDPHGLFDDVIGSDGRRNLKGSAKLAAIRELVGERFCYAGDSRADVVVWSGATRAVLVGDVARLRRLTPRSTIEAEFSVSGPGWRTWVRTIRAYQWLKNMLILVPLLTSFSLLDQHRVVLALLAFAAFSSCASATYIVNDLWDLDNDRNHAHKSKRPLASGEISIPSALLMAVALLGGGFGLALLANGRFALILAVYLVTTSAYSWVLKRYVIADVLTLACLYTLRIVAGAVVIGVPLTTWLLAFSVFLFFSLALVKRCAELVSLHEAGADGAVGRNYKTTDLEVLWPTGVGSGVAAVVVFGLFINSPETQSQYASPYLMWLVALALFYWVMRLWIKTSRGEMHDDPIVYSLRDPNSRISVVLMLVISVLARFVKGF